jgi:hypothetical protein
MNIRGVAPWAPLLEIAARGNRGATEDAPTNLRQLDNSANSQVKSRASFTRRKCQTLIQYVYQAGDRALDTRIFRAMAAASALAVIVSAFLGPMAVHHRALLIGGVWLDSVIAG